MFRHYGLLGTCTALENVELTLSFTGGPARGGGAGAGATGNTAFATEFATAYRSS